MNNLDQRAFAMSLDLVIREEAGQHGKGSTHPTPEALAAYHAGELSEDENERIQLHLAFCSECPDLLIDLEDLFEPRHRDLDLSDSWISGAWGDLRAKLNDSQKSKSPSWRRWMHWFSAIPRPVHALATALLFIALTGSAMTAVRLRQELRQAVAPLGNVPSKAVLAGSSTRSASEETKPIKATRIEFKPQQRAFRLDLRLVSEKRYERIVAQISDRDSEGIYTIGSLEQIQIQDQIAKQIVQYAQLTLLRASLTPGRYEIQLTGYENAQDEGSALGKYPIEIVHL